MKVRLDVAAEQDLDAYLDPIESDDPIAALRQQERIRVGLRTLAEYPALGRRTPLQSGPPEVRGFPIANTPLVAFYVGETGGIRVLRLFYGAREPITR